jgi:integrase
MATVRKREWGEGKEAWILTYTDDAGKRRQETFNSKKAADNRRREVEHEIDIGVHVSKGETLTLFQAIDQYIADSERLFRLGDVTRGTVSNRTEYAKRIPPCLGRKLVTEITPADAQSWTDSLREKYKPNTVNSSCVFLESVLKFCLRKKWLKRNPLLGEPMERPRQDKRAKIPSIEDLGKLLQTVSTLIWDRGSGDKTHLLINVNRLCAITLGIYAGLRPGEVFGLHWEDIDQEAGLIRVQHNFTWRDGLKAPKTKAGIRKVPLNKQIEFGLSCVARYWAARTHAESQADRRQSGGAFQNRIHRHFRESLGDYDRKGFVIRSRNGGPLSCHNSPDFFNTLMRSAGLVDEAGKPKFTMHALRHAHASLLLKENLPLHQLKQVMGHASAQFTIDTYGHIFPEDRQIFDVSARIGDKMDATRMRQRLITH